jgi:hypothetical protein
MALLDAVQLNMIMLTALLDPYENIYTVIRGEKHFTLLPPD